MSTPPKIKVTSLPGEEPPLPEVMAQAIVDIAAAAKRLTTGPLRLGAVVLLISHSAKVPQKTVRAVLAAMEQSETDYLKPRSTR